MTREEARNYILTRSSEHFRRDRSGKGYICPICGSGTGAKGTGITTRDGVHFTCWTGCFESSDIFDIIGLEQGLTDYNSQLQAACKEFGITLGESEPDLAEQTPKPVKQLPDPDQEEPEPDYTNFILKANKDLSKTDYHRGISLETLNRFKVGYVENWRHPKAPATVPTSPRLIVPTSRHSYMARDTRFNLTKEQEDYRKSKVGRTRIFNLKAIGKANKPIIICEGEIDALSIIDVGGEAVGLGGLSGVGKLLKYLQYEKPRHPLIIALDNEPDPKKQEKVDKAAEELEAGLDELGISHYRINLYGERKDANEAMNEDREAFRKAVKETEDIETKQEREKLQMETALHHLPGFIQEIKNKTYSYTRTGFRDLDDLLDGGLYAGLNIIGAISSLGKTSFCLQIADNIAQAGKKVLFFSLEMETNELIAKSLSRHTFQETQRTGSDKANAKTTRGILNGSLYDNYNMTEKQLIRTAIDQYREYAGNIWIIEGLGDITTDIIREKVEIFTKAYRETPVVIIDYLQIIAPHNERSSDKQNMDQAVRELKRLARDYRLPIVVISSFNRGNYLEPVNLASFKESGQIEYSSDVLIGLQYTGMDYQEAESEKDRTKRIRDLFKKAQEDGNRGGSQSIQVKVLKQRSGRRESVLLNYYPVFNCYETPQQEDPEDQEEWTTVNGAPEF